jgi:uncharacterized cupin superfamily protein
LDGGNNTKEAAMPRPIFQAQPTAQKASRPIVNLDELQFEPWSRGFPPDERPPAGFGARKAAVAQRIGAKKLGYNVTAIAPGKCAYPLHNHRVNEEMFLILQGEGQLRVGKDTWPVRGGDFIACPPGGPETAHQLKNTSNDRDLTVLAVSTFEETDIIEYPRTGKIAFGGLFEGPDGKPTLIRGLHRAGHDAGYWEGE